MTEIDVERSVDEQPVRRLHWEWLLPILYRPHRTMKRITGQDHPVWLAPLIVLTALAILQILFTAPVRRLEAQTISGPPPEMMDYYTPDQKAQFEQGLASGQGSLFIYIFPAIGSLLGVWVSWILLGSILHLTLTLSGSRSTSVLAFNLAGWASFPLAVRHIVQTTGILATQKMIANPGLSGFLSPESGGFLIFLRSMLANFDLYFLWMAFLLFVGVATLPGLNKVRVRIAALAAVVILLSLVALPGFIGASLGQLSTGGRGMFFF